MNRFLKYVQNIFRSKMFLCASMIAFVLALGVTVTVPKKMEAFSLVNSKDSDIILRKPKKWNGVYGIYTNIKPLSDGGMGYCMDSNKPHPPNGVELYQINDPFPKEVLNAMKYGYPNRKFYSQSGEYYDWLNYYVTQTVIWGFLDGFNESDISTFFRAPDCSPQYKNENIETLKTHMKNFMTEIRNIGSPPTATVSLSTGGLNSYVSNGKMVTDWITVNGSQVSGNVQLQVSGAPAGTVIKNSSGSVVSSVPVGSKFYVEFPLQSYNGSFTIRGKAMGTVQKTKSYTTNNDDWQRISTYNTYNVDYDLFTGSCTINFASTDGSLQIFKQDQSNGVRLPGANFRVTGPNGFSKDITTDGNGSYYLSGLKPGNYTVTETRAPAGYIAVSGSKNVTVNPGAHSTVTFDNKKNKGTIEVTKKGEDSKLLQGAEFKVTRDSDGAVMGTMTTDANGKARLGNLERGTYTVTETRPPTGYLLSNTPSQKVSFFVDASDTVQTKYLTYVNNRVKATASLIKLDSETKQPLQGAQFRITGPEGYNVVKEPNNVGRIMLQNIIYGDYTIEEIKVPTGYLKGGPWNFSIRENGKTYTIEMNNTPIRGDVDILKIDSETKKPIPNVEFRITGPKGYDVTKTTNDQGKIHLDNVLYGEYQIVETRPGVGYLPNTNTHRINVTKHGESHPITIENDIIRGNVELTKIDSETKKPIPDVEFNITGPEGYNVTKTTNDKGIILLENVRYGVYTIRETRPGVGYLPNTNTYTVDVNKHGQTFKIEIENDIMRGDVKLYKTDQDLGIPVRGATFRITGPEGYDVTKKTDNDGIITLEEVRYGNYHIVETKPAVGYLPATEEWDVFVNAHGQVFELRIQNKIIEGDIIVDKTDGVNGKLLPNALFQIRSLDFRVDGEIPVVHELLTTDENGRIRLDNLRYGHYEVKEMKAPEGYLVETEPFVVNINGDKDEYEYEVTNELIRGDVIILKTDRETGEPLKGAEFRIKGIDNPQYERTVVSTKDGTAKFAGVPYGRYKVTEIKAPTGYVLDKTEHEFNIHKDGQIVNIEHRNVINKGYIEIIKKDNETGELLENAHFEVYDENGTRVSLLKTDKNGWAKTGLLNYGKYTMKEVKPPVGYNPNPKVYEIFIEEDGKTYTYEILNQVIKGKIKVIKTDKLDNSLPVSDVEFSVWKKGQNPETDEPLHKIVTDENGIATTPPLRYGEYFIRETATREDYYLNEGQWEFFIETEGETYPVEIENAPVITKVKLVKSSSQTNKRLSNANFQIWDAKTDKPITFSIIDEEGRYRPINTFKSDEKGVITIPQVLRYGDYKIVEVEPPVGFHPITPIEFSVNKQSPFVERDGEMWLDFSATDEIIKGNVELTKKNKDNNGALMPGVTFELVRVTNPENHKLGKVGEYTTGDEGKIRIENLPYGEYYLKEIKTLEGFVLDETPIPFMIQEEDTTIELTMDNSWIRGNVKLVKTDVDTKEVLKDVTFELYKYQGRERVLVGEYTTNEKGELEIKDLPYGKYELEEVKTLENYNLDKTPITFFIQENGKTLELSMTNEKKKGDLELTKKDVATGKPLPNAGFTIWSEDKKTEIVKGETDENGVAYFKELPYGKYYYQEYNAPEGYVIDESLFPFEIKEDGEVVKAKMTNEKIKGSLELSKVDISTGELIPNAKFVISENLGTKEEPKKGEVVAKGITDENGMLRIDNLEYGKYIYEEMEAPEGYILNDALMPFEILENGSIIKSEVPNEKIKGNLEILKVDSKTNEPLEDAYFEVYHKEDKEGKKPIYKGKTNKEGILRFENVLYGEYYVKELRAPAGYTLNDKTEKFEIVNNKDLAQVKFENDKVAIVKTGSVMTYGILGLGVSGLGGLTLFRRKFRK